MIFLTHLDIIRGPPSVISEARDAPDAPVEGKSTERERSSEWYRGAKLDIQWLLNAFDCLEKENRQASQREETDIVDLHYLCKTRG